MVVEASICPHGVVESDVELEEQKLMHPSKLLKLFLK